MKPQHEKILIIEDDPDGRRSLIAVVEDAGYEVFAAEAGIPGVDMFKSEEFDLVVSDLVLPDIDGVEVMERILALDADIPVIIMTAYGSVSNAVKALKAGAYDYITKPLDLEDVQSRISRALETRQLRVKVEELHKSVEERYGTRAMVAESEAMKAVVDQVRSLADTNATVMISGESGAGKEMVARALHVDGKRRNGPFVAVNCGAFSESILESELFGHEKGAFTGAVKQHKGAFERADGGTLFLDEIGEASKNVQVKLLRVLEDREIMRVGGQKAVPVDVRIISASNSDIDSLVEDGEFREDLLYRLKVVVLNVPPLRERKRDVRVLIDSFVKDVCREHGRVISCVEEDCYKLFEAQKWPGNVRQLRNVVESSVVMSQGSVLRAEDVRLGDAGRKKDSEFDVPEEKTFEELEKEILLQVLSRCQGNRTVAAEQLAISRRTIQRKIKEYDLPF